jgi:hypothetical protein
MFLDGVRNLDGRRRVVGWPMRHRQHRKAASAARSLLRQGWKPGRAETAPCSFRAGSVHDSPAAARDVRYTVTARKPRSLMIEADKGSSRRGRADSDLTLPMRSVAMQSLGFSQ